MKFDVVIMNPPYQAKTKNNNKGTTLWDKFVSTGFKYLNKEGFFAAVHPSGWRDNSQTFKEAHVVRNNNLLYLSVHNEQDGMLTFGASTRYDWYICQNQKYNCETLIEDEDGNHVAVNILNLPVIPNHSIKLVDKFIAKPGEEKVQILYSRTAYGADKSHVSKIQDEKNCYPVIYSVSTSGPTIFWSSTTANGHYGTKKLIFNPNRPIASLIDRYGEYAMSQWCVGILGDDKYLTMVKQVFDNQKTNGFSHFMEACHLTDTIFNRRVFKEFRKDFWKDFV